MAFGHHEDHTSTHGYEPMRERRWRRSPGAGGGSRT
jgi:hypothetical protein